MFNKPIKIAHISSIFLTKITFFSVKFHERNYMKKILTILTLISTLFANEPTDFDEITTEDVPKILSIIKDGTKESLPIVLDDYTTVFDVISVHNLIEYKNLINTSNEHVKMLLKADKGALAKATFENNRNYLCSDSETLLLLKKGAVFSYIFYDFTNIQLFKFSVQYKDCEIK